MTRGDVSTETEPVLVIATESHGPLLTAEVFDHVWIAWGAFRDVETMSIDQLITLLMSDEAELDYAEMLA